MGCTNGEATDWVRRASTIFPLADPFTGRLRATSRAAGRVLTYPTPRRPQFAIRGSLDCYEPLQERRVLGRLQSLREPAVTSFGAWHLPGERPVLIMARLMLVQDRLGLGRQPRSRQQRKGIANVKQFDLTYFITISYRVWADRDHFRFPVVPPELRVLDSPSPSRRPSCCS